MTLEEKAGQLFCVLGELYDEETLKFMVRKRCIGGVLFRPSPKAALQAKFDELDKCAAMPLLKAANMESGSDGAISDGFLFANPLQVAATGDDAYAEYLGKVCASDGESSGINWTFSPVVDIDLNFRNPITNTRTFGSDAETVEKYALKYISAVQETGHIAACVKHFPGDGVDFRDHHLHPSVNSLSSDEWHKTYGKIYKAAIDSGVKSIMAGHICQPNLSDNPLPASLNKDLLVGVLREKFGFNGVVTTDATIMGGFCQAVERRLAIPRAIAAGCDMFVFNTDFEEDCAYIIEGVRNGILAEERLDEAVSRIVALKESLGLFENRINVASQLPAKKWRRECAEKSITLIKNAENLLPLKAENISKVRLIIKGNPNCPDGIISDIASRLLQKRGIVAETFNIEKENMRGSAGFTKDLLTLYFANCEQKSDQTVVRLFWSEKFALDMPRFINESPHIFVSLANPYHLQDVPRVKTYINAYTANSDTIEAVIKALFGEIPFKGKSPVDAFCGLWDARL
ncbi:MAG: glycosyl hydrolase family 3 [Clostridiales bacterium]|jgi:beta-N-acetylhexosaminidase|nr:glycosyl hydrolase family 3 [Clostridiales bacterium]